MANESEILHLHIGSGSIEIGNNCWQLYCLEHQLSTDGFSRSESNLDRPPQCFFSESNDQIHRKHRPRALFIDSDSTAFDRIRSSTMKNFYNDNQYVRSTESTDSILNEIRKQIEVDDYFQGFIFSHSIDGQSSNLSSKLLTSLKSEYAKKTILTNSIVGSTIDICNMSHLLKHADVIIPMENKAIRNLCQHQLNIETPTYSNLNRLIATCWSNITSSMRFDGCLLAALNEFPSILVPFPSFKLISSYLSPLIPYTSSLKHDFKSPSVYDMCIPSLTQPNNCFISQVSPYKMALCLCLLFRGANLIPKEIGQKLICDMKKSIRSSDRSSCGFRCGINYHRPTIFDDHSDIAQTDKQVFMLTNEISTSKYLCQRALNEHVKSSTDIEVTEAENHLQELITDYEEWEKEIVNENQLDSTSPLT